jgi:hypothetical protein
MRVELLYFDGCPGWRDLAHRLDLLATEFDFAWVPVRVQTPQEAEAIGFPGSPSLRIDGRDPFPSAAAPGALACRLYATSEGLASSPDMSDLRRVFLAAAGGQRPL